MTFLGQSWPNWPWLKLREIEAGPTLLKIFAILTRLSDELFQPEVKYTPVLTKRIDRARETKHPLLFLIQVHIIWQPLLPTGIYCFGYWQAIDDATVMVVMCQNLHTRAQRYNKMKNFNFSTKSLSFLPSTILAYGWGWDGGRTLKWQLEVNHSFLVQNGLL